MKFEYLKRDGTWSEKVGLTRMRVVAATRVVAGRGPFSGTKNGNLQFEKKSRLEALNKLVRLAKDGKVGDVYRVRNGQSVVVFTTREAKAYELDPKRAAFVQQCRWGIAHEGSFHYSQQRPIPQYREHVLPLYLDCSSSTVTFARWAGCPSPTGSWSSGSTDTILAHCKNIERRDLQVGDLCLWAYGNDGKHVAVVIETGPDPLLESHGSEAGPLAIRLSAEDRYHSSETLHYLSFI